MTVELNTISEGIAGLNFPGVKVLDLTEVSEGIGWRDTPAMFPFIPDFMTDFVMVRKAFQPGRGSKWECHYNLHYLFIYAPSGSDRGISIYEKMVNKALAIINVIQKATVDIDGATTVQVQEPLNFGTIEAPNGDKYMGCEIVLNVLDIQELS